MATITRTTADADAYIRIGRRFNSSVFNMILLE